MRISKRMGWLGLVLLAFVAALVLMVIGFYSSVFIMEGSIDEEAMMKSAGFASMYYRCSDLFRSNYGRLESE